MVCVPILPQHQKSMMLPNICPLQKSRWCSFGAAKCDQRPSSSGISPIGWLDGRRLRSWGKTFMRRARMGKTRLPVC
jgi:hypothetical protein